MQNSGQTVLRTWAYSEKFGSNALQPGPYQINDRVAEALDWVVYQVRQSRPISGQAETVRALGMQL